MTTLFPSIALVVVALLAWDAWRKYLAAADRTAGLKALEANMVKRLVAVELDVAAAKRAIGIRAIAQARREAES